MIPRRIKIIEERLVSDEEIKRLDKLKTFELETAEDLKILTGIFDEDSEIEEHEPETEQSIDFNRSNTAKVKTFRQSSTGF